MIYLMTITVFVFIASLVYYYYNTKVKHSELKHRFEGWSEETIVASQGKKKDSSVLKTLLPLLRVLGPFNDLIPLGFLKRRISRALIAGNVPMTVNDFLALKELSAVLAVGLYILITDKIPEFETGFVSAGIGFFFPDMFLKGHIDRRKKEIAKDLPNVIDLLKLCVEAGMDFMLAVKRVVRDYKPCAVTEELSNVWRQIQMGRSRAEALKHFAWRVDMPEVSSFVRALIQGDKMGTPIGDILKVQADEMRMYRILKAEEEAMKAPVKMLLPLLFFIMPVILIVVAGPILLQFIRGDIFKGFQ